MNSSSSWIPKQRKDLTSDSLVVIDKVLSKIPQLPVSVTRIIDITSDADVSVQDLADVTMTDPVLSSKILQQVNSAYYGLTRRIDNLRVAVVLLGFNAIRNFAIQNKFLSMLDFSDGESIYDRDELWTHSYQVSITAEKLIENNDPHEIGTVLTMGLLHDIGKFALYSIGMMMREKGLTSPVFDKIDESTPLLSLEERLFGVNHAIIGGMLARKWNLSERIQYALEYHHYPSYWDIKCINEKYARDIALISISDCIVNRFNESNKNLKLPGNDYFEILHIHTSFDTLLTNNLRKRLNYARSFIKELK